MQILIKSRNKTFRGIKWSEQSSLKWHLTTWNQMLNEIRSNSVDLSGRSPGGSSCFLGLTSWTATTVIEWRKTHLIFLKRCFRSKVKQQQQQQCLRTGRADLHSAGTTKQRKDTAAIRRQCNTTNAASLQQHTSLRREVGEVRPRSSKNSHGVEKHFIPALGERFISTGAKVLHFPCTSSLLQPRLGRSTQDF